MAKLTQEKILTMTEMIIYEKGMEKTTLYDIAKRLGVTHAALYKHYKNKEDLFQKLALHWLAETSDPILAWKPEASLTKTEALHEWLWLLAQTKKALYKTDKRMFLLYTDYIEKNSDLVTQHLHHLAKKAEEISGWINFGEAILTAFVYFHNPYFANRWENDGYLELFEKLWQLLLQTKEN
ncbi:TetR/AcrR family transcriptional regulator [Carnobacterium gallinarum]|uniref:TetR/AcrR family transcriptional regulator n=1 Tax=Carnobacterium gallinarum TaxID=2749 RepID=UPI0005571BBD|nr:TetR family transcriptional regulator [Carnobacterium gallinarum]